MLITTSVCLLSVAVVSVAAYDKDARCDRFCICDISSATCKGTTLKYIPRLPARIMIVTITNTNLSYIGKYGLFNLTFNVIKKLNLTKNNISYIHPEAFTNITRMTTFILSQEPNLDPNVLKLTLSCLPKKDMKNVHLTDHQWTELPTDMFVSFVNSRVKNLYLTGNRFSFLNCTSFNPFYFLTTLWLSENKIQHISVRGLPPNLLHLKLNKNLFLKVPKWCESDRHFAPSLVPSLEDLSLSSNYIGYLGTETLRCLPRVKILNLENTHIGKIQSNVFSRMSNLHTLTLTRIPLKEIDSFAFNSSSLQTLHMDQTYFHFDRYKFNPETIFSLCPMLTNLDLSKSHLPKSDELLNVILHPLANLETLTLVRTNLGRLPKNVLPHLVHLKKVNFRNNAIRHWNESDKIFGNLTSLISLELSVNDITVVNKTSFPLKSLVSLKRLNLDVNPFSCTCDQMWFINWVKTTNIKLVNYNYYKCSHPSKMNGLHLKEYHPTEEICTPWNPLYTTAIVVSSCVVFVMGTILFFIKCQTNVKNYIYLLRVSYNRRRGYILIDNNADFEYHAFVVYCDADRQWVHKKFLRKIENEEGIKLCIHQRDFDVGETITGNIDKYLQKSSKVVVVMSNNFAKSEWCQWEVDVVQERRRRQGRDVLLLIMLKNIDSKHMTSQLRTLLDSTPHLTFQAGIGEELFWKAAIESLRRPLGEPPIAVL